MFQVSGLRKFFKQWSAERAHKHVACNGIAPQNRCMQHSMQHSSGVSVRSVQRISSQEYI